MGKTKPSVRASARGGFYSTRSRGQLSVEFFLTIAFLLALAIALITTSQSKVDSASELTKGLQAKTALDALSTKSNSVYLQGPASQYSFNAFIPSSSICFLYNSTTKKLYCDFGTALNQRPVSGTTLYSEPEFDSINCPPQNPLSGWFNLVVKNNAGVVQVSCTKLG